MPPEIARPLVWIPLAAAVVHGAAAVYVLSLTRRRLLRLAGLYMLAIAIAAFGVYSARVAGSAEAAQFWTRGAAIYPLLSVFFLRMSCEWTGFKTGRWVRALLYAVGVGLSGALLVQGFGGVARVDGLWLTQVDPTPVVRAAAGFAALATLAGAGLSVIHHVQSRPDERRRQAWMMLGLTLPFAGVTFIELLPRMIGLADTPHGAGLVLAAATLALVHGLRTHDALVPLAASREVILSLNEALAVTEQERSHPDGQPGPVRDHRVLKPGARGHGPGRALGHPTCVAQRL